MQNKEISMKISEKAKDHW